MTAINASGSSASSIEEIITTDVVTSVEGSVLTSGIFPTPTIGILHFKEPVSTFTILHLSDLSGRSVEMEMLDANRMRLNVPQGIYILQVRGKHTGRVVQLKIVKE
jgi:hypothetical protein